MLAFVSVFGFAEATCTDCVLSGLNCEHSVKQTLMTPMLNIHLGLILTGEGRQ